MATSTAHEASGAISSGVEGCLRVPEDHELLNVNDKITGKGWKMFFRRLGLKEGDIVTVEHQNSELKEQTWQLLLLWRERNGAQATFRQLIDAAKGNEQKDLADQIECIATGTNPNPRPPAGPENQTILTWFTAFLASLTNLNLHADPPAHNDAPVRPEKLIMPAAGCEDEPSEADHGHPLNQSVINSPTTNPLFVTSRGWPYSYLGAPLLKNAAIGGLLALIILQLWVCIVLSVLLVHQQVTERHSVRNWFFLLLSIFLRFFTFCLLPLLLLGVASHAMARRLDGVSSAISLRREIEKKVNGPVLKKIIAHFWDQGVLDKDHSTILKDLSHQLASEFYMMCCTSICEAFLLTLALVRIGVTEFSPSDYSLPLDCSLCTPVEVLNVIYYFLLFLFIGIFSSVYYHEATVHRLVDSAVELLDFAHWHQVKPSKKLTEAAKNAVNRFNNKWGELEILVVVAVQIYVLALILFASSGQPVSGNRNAQVTGEHAHLYWLFFVVFFTICHFLATCVWPTAHSSAPYRCIGILFEFCGVIILYISQPPALGGVLHLLYTIIPAAYLFWYLWLKLHQENSVRRAKPAGVRKQHGGRIVMMAGLMILLCTAISVCLISEYSIIQSNVQTALEKY